MTGLPTPVPELNAVLEALVAGVRPILGENFVGAYLQGSLAVGDWEIGSDIDFLFVTHADVPEELVPALQAVHVRVYDQGPDYGRHLEGSYFPTGWLRRLDMTGRPLLYIDNGSRVMERSPHDNTLVVRWVLREHGVTLAGPAPSALLEEPVPPDALRREALGMLRGWAAELQADPKQMNTGWYQPFAVLSFCRMLRTVATGQVHSKPAAAAWAQATLDPCWKDLIERAWAQHAGQFTRVYERADPVDYERTHAFVRYVLAESDRISPDSLGTP
jgi:hypothetical protein